VLGGAERWIIQERLTCLNCGHFHGWYSSEAINARCLYCPREQPCEHGRYAPPPKCIVVDGIVYGPVSTERPARPAKSEVGK